MVSPTAPRILIVDDDAHLRETLRDLLELENFQVFEAGSGAEAMKQVVTGFFDVILMDFNLADQTGIEVIREIHKVTTESEILMMTAHASLDTAVKAIQESVFDFLTKPVDFNYLRRQINRALEKRRLQQENKRLIEALRQTNEQLLRLNNMKSKFLSMASHDLSNALMTLQVSFELLSQTITPNEEQKKRVQHISTGLSQIARLVEDLVDWASIEQGRFRLEKNPLQVGKVVENLLVGLRERAAMKNVQVLSDIAAGLPVLVADQRRLSQVLMNMLENAIRHTPRGGRINVGVRAEGGEVTFTVKDSGDGIDPKDLPRLFESFYQAGGEGAPHGRLGLGLSISREIVISHGGRIWVDSEGIGKGAAFHFTVPAGTPSAAAGRPPAPGAVGG